MPPIGSVTINWHPETEEITLEPEVGKVNRNIQVMQWSLAVPSGSSAKFGPTGIVFESSPPAQNPWPPTTVLQRENDWQYRADVHHKVAHGQQAQIYSYFIDIDRGTGPIIRFLASHHQGENVTSERVVPKVLTFDPEIANEPQP